MNLVSSGTHNYELPIMTITDSGLEHSGIFVDLPIVRGSKLGEGVEKQDGVITEHLLQVAVEYLSAVNVGEMRTRETSLAITKIEEALMWIEARRKNREKRGVLSTYKK